MGKQSDGISRVVVDADLLVAGAVTRLHARGELRAEAVVVPRAVLVLLEHQVRHGMGSGRLGLRELDHLRALDEDGELSLLLEGEEPRGEVGPELAGKLARELASSMEGAALLTGSEAEAELARARGVPVRLVETESATDEDVEASRLAAYFEEDVLSVHLKEGCRPQAKRGSVVSTELTDLDGEELSMRDVEGVLDEVVLLARTHRGSVVEIEHTGSVVVQLGPYRVAAALPPFSDGLEVTAVRQVRQLELEEYDLDPDFVDHLEDYHRGVLLSGRPGDGKTTFARAVAMHLRSLGAVVKTMESPRDMVLPPDVTQYAPLDGSWELTAELLLMVRPDFVVFDEVRKTDDFQVYSDMRLAGVGLIGVVHANSAINAVQRLLGRVEMGLLPQIVDTIVHLREGRVEQALRLVPTVKVPEGMYEQDLARPVVLVEDFHTGEPQFELYTYGDQLVVMPVSGGGPRRGGPSADDVAARLQPMATGDLEVVMDRPGRAQVFVHPQDASAIIGRNGRTVRELERELGVRIDVVTGQAPGAARGPPERVEDFSFRETKNNVMLYISQRHQGRTASVEVGGRSVGSARISRRGGIRFARRSRAGRAILDAVDSGDEIVIVL